MIDNPNTTNTAVLETRCDLRVFASIARFYRDSGVALTSRSRILRMIMEDFHTALIAQGLATEIATTEEAIVLLNDFGLGIGKSMNRMQKGLAKQLTIEKRTQGVLYNPVADALTRLTEDEG